MDQPSNVSEAAGHLAKQIIGNNPKTWGVIFIALFIVMIILIIVCVVYMNKYNDCVASHKSTMLGNPLGNLNTGGNNPMWHHQMGDAGWGGPLHSSYQHGESRVWGSSAEDQGRHDHHAVVPQYGMSCGSGLHNDPMRHPAAAEAHALMSVQAYEPASSKHLNDDDLINVMNGTH